MLTREDLVDLLMEHLRAKPGKAMARMHAPQGRIFLAEHEIKKMLTPGSRQLTIPRDAILSPLACDWLVLQGIKIIRE